MKTKIKVERKLHPGWVEFEGLLNFVYSPLQVAPELPEKIKQKLLNNMFGKYQNIYSFPNRDKNIKISLIKIDKMWEIYSYDTLFKDVLRFKTKKEAVNEIMRLLK